MPIYEYYCKECGHEFEVMQKITEGPLRKCEKCGRLKAKRKISHTSFVLKGSGWYVTDYGGKKPTDTHRSSENDKKSENTDKSETKSDSKSDSAKDTAKTATA